MFAHGAAVDGRQLVSDTRHTHVLTVINIYKFAKENLVATIDR